MGEIRMMSFQYVPRGWAACAGQLMPISQNSALFSLLGVQFGGDGRNTFGLPDLRGRTPLHRGTGRIVGQVGGAETHTVSVAEMPVHTHPVVAAATPDSLSPVGANFAGPGKQAFTGTGTGPMHAGAIAEAGGSQPHENRPPYLVVNYVIAITGIYPSRP